MKIHLPSYKITGAAAQCRAPRIFAGLPRRLAFFNFKQYSGFSGGRLELKARLFVKNLLTLLK
jgi:hypothetical protein